MLLPSPHPSQRFLSHALFLKIFFAMQKGERERERTPVYFSYEWDATV
jgi:hypothetical protein